MTFLAWRQLVSGDLPARELVKRHVAVQGLNHKIAVSKRKGAILIAFLAVTVRIPRHVEPVPTPAFAVMNRAQAGFDQFLGGLGIA